MYTAYINQTHPFIKGSSLTDLEQELKEVFRANPDLTKSHPIIRVTRTSEVEHSTINTESFIS